MLISTPEQKLYHGFQGVEYNAGMSMYGPSPYSPPFAIPPYSEHKEPLPAYSNLGYDDIGSVATSSPNNTVANAITSSDNATTTTDAYETISTESNG